MKSTSWKGETEKQSLTVDFSSKIKQDKHWWIRNKRVRPRTGLFKRWIALSTGEITVQRINTSKTVWVIQWILIYPLDSAIQPSNNWGLHCTEIHWMCTCVYMQWILSYWNPKITMLEADLNLFKLSASTTDLSRLFHLGTIRSRGSYCHIWTI